MRTRRLHKAIENMNITIEFNLSAPFRQLNCGGDSNFPHPRPILHQNEGSHHYAQFIPGGHLSRVQLEKLVKQAYEEVLRRAAPIDGLVSPNAMAALHKPGVGTWLHSTVFNQHNGAKPFHPETLSLRCQGYHRFGGSCAEIGAIDAAHADGYDVRGAHMAVFGYDRKADCNSYFAPCVGVDGDFGCADVLEKAQVRCWTGNGPRYPVPVPRNDSGIERPRVQVIESVVVEYLVG